MPFMAMPVLVGESLADRLKREGPLPIGECVRIARAVAEGLAAAHAMGLIHRDIKPGNIFLQKYEASTASSLAASASARSSVHRRVAQKPPKVILLDFGLVRNAAEENQQDRLTGMNAILGTPDYMSPEQARGEARSLDHRSDLFSLGGAVSHAHGPGTVHGKRCD